MRLIEVLPDYEAKRFSRPPVMTSDDRKKYFKIDDSIRASIEKTKQPDNKVGLLVQYGYFKLCGKFLAPLQKLRLSILYSSNDWRESWTNINLPISNGDILMAK